MSATLRPAPASVLHSPDFLKLWIGQTISSFGTQVTILAVPIVAALTLHVSPFEFGLLTTIEFIPFVVLSLPAGVWVDRLRRRPILVAADVVRALCLLSIPLAFALGSLTIWQLYLVVFVNGCLTVFFDVAYQSYLPSIVDRDQLVEGNARLELTRGASQRLGPGLGGALIGIATAPVALLVDAVSYIVSAVSLLMIRRNEGAIEPHDEATGPRPSVRADITAGLRYVGGHRWLRALALTVAIGNLFGHVADSILILYLVTERQVSPALVGLAFTIGSVGVFAGALVAPPLTKAIGVGPTILLTSVGGSISWIPVAIAPDDVVFAGLTITIAALSFFGIPWSVIAVSLRQAVTPPAMLGRMNATMRFISWGTVPVGALVGGFLGGVIGLHNTIWVGALGCLAGFVPVALSSLRRLRAIPSVADVDTPLAGTGELEPGRV